MRILYCKKDRDHELVKNAPRMYDYLNDESKNYFETVKAKLDDLNIAYEVDYNLVRGLDYYTHTAFELMSDSEGFGAITTLCGGGRYNGLLEMMDGPDKTGIGFALSIERLLLALEAEGIEIPENKGIDLYVCTMNGEARDTAGTLLHNLRARGISADMDYENRKLKAQMKDADRKNARYTIVLGEDELNSQSADLKEMATGETQQLSFDEIINTLEEL